MTKTQTLIDLTVKRRTGEHLVTEDQMKGLDPDTAKEVIELKYATGKKKRRIQIK